ncbi:MAG: hypothetical protein DRZ79_06310 [Candidatus Cloacimonadota bacterium]|nr:MAG: hypothetical protein DRZ79_06310 [Candidatus Cloacimonadota bacterium]
MTKIDFKKELKYLYSPSKKEVIVVDVPVMNFLMVDGEGNPNNSAQFQDAIDALYNISFTIKMLPKKGIVPQGYFEYVVPPLEALWWTDEINNFNMENKNSWKWTLMIMQPEFVTKNLVEETIVTLKKKKQNPALSKVRFATFDEGLSAQILYIGPYSEEAPTIKKIHDFIEEHGYKSNGKHHEIYLSDPRRTAPEKLKTILRQPIKPKN